MYSKKTFLSTALDSRKYKGYSTTLPESHVPTIWADIQDWPRMGDASRIVIEKQTKKDGFTKIKDFASENDIKLGVVLDVLGIYLSELALRAIESINYGAKK